MKRILIGLVAAIVIATGGFFGFEFYMQLVGWVEPLRNPSHVAIAMMGFAPLNPSYELIALAQFRIEASTGL